MQVSQSSPAEDPTAWAEFTKRVKEGIIARFDTNITLYEEDVRKADSQRQLPGWNFCTFFTQKEALADCFEAMNLIEDALIQYDELEASFFATLKGPSSLSSLFRANTAQITTWRGSGRLGASSQATMRSKSSRRPTSTTAS